MNELKALSGVVLFFYVPFSITSTKEIDQLYEYGGTYDKGFCNVDSLIPTDCGMGIFYFTKKGYVVHSYYCYGSDTTSFDIGTYSKSDSEVICNFEISYAFFNGFIDDDESLPYNPNNGRVKIEKKWIIKLKKLACESFDYGFKSSDSSNFVLSKGSSSFSKHELADLKRIKRLSLIWK